jgi:hypothetical protein
MLLPNPFQINEDPNGIARERQKSSYSTVESKRLKEEK